MNLKEQEYICEIAKHKSITRAAKELNLTQSALSLFLLNLEKQLGVKLFERVRKEMIPTYAGEIYLKYSQSILDLGAECDLKIHDIIYKVAGRIRFGINSRRSPFIVPELLVKMHRLYPDVRIEVEESDTLKLLERLENQELDCIYTYEECQIPTVAAELLLEDRIGFAVRKDDPVLRYAQYHEERDYYELGLSYLKNKTFLLYENDEKDISFHELLQSAGIDPLVYRFYNVETILQLTCAGYGITYINEMYIKNFKYRGNSDELVFVLPTGSRDETKIYLSYIKSLTEKEYGRDFIDMIKELKR